MFPKGLEDLSTQYVQKDIFTSPPCYGFVLAVCTSFANMQGAVCRAVCGVRGAVCGVRGAVCGVRSCVYGMRGIDCRVQGVDCGVRGVDCGVWGMSCRRVNFAVRKRLGIKKTFSFHVTWTTFKFSRNQLGTDSAYAMWLCLKPGLHIVVMVVSIVANMFLTLSQAVLIQVNTLISTSQAWSPL